MLNRKLAEEIRLYYSEMRENAELAAEARKAEILLAHPELAALEEALADNGFLRLRASMSSQPELAEAEAAYERLSAERVEMLSRLGLAEDYAPIQYHCQTCKDYGFVLGSPCPSCYPQAIARIWQDAEAEDVLGEASFQDFDLSLFDDEGPLARNPRLRMKALKARMEAYVEAFANEEGRSEQSNLFFSGVTGTGKTYLATCIGKALRERGKSVLMLSAPQLLRIVAEQRVLSKSFNPSIERLETLSRRLEQIYNCDFLIIDDLGTEALDAHASGDLLALLNQRERSRKALLVTTNLDMKQLRERYEERIFSRIARSFQNYAFIGADLRAPKRGA